MPYILKKRKPHTCWTPLGLLVFPGTIWQCGKCKRYWMRASSDVSRWFAIHATVAEAKIAEEGK